MPETIHEVREEIAQHGHREAIWRVGSSATPGDLVDRLAAHGFVPADSPGNEPHLTSMVLTDEPPPVDGVEARRVASAGGAAACKRISAPRSARRTNDVDWDARFASERAGHTPRMYLAFVDGVRGRRRARARRGRTARR